MADSNPVAAADVAKAEKPRVGTNLQGNGPSSDGEVTAKVENRRVWLNRNTKVKQAWAVVVRIARRTGRTKRPAGVRAEVKAPRR